jgi:hypothetical protein
MTYESVTAWILNENIDISFSGGIAYARDKATSLNYEFDSVGALILDHADGKSTLEDISIALSERLDVDPDKAARDSEEFLEILVDTGLIEAVKAEVEKIVPRTPAMIRMHEVLAARIVERVPYSEPDINLKVSAEGLMVARSVSI